jgi:hypothetical protein
MSTDAHSHEPGETHSHAPSESHTHSHGAHDYEVPDLPESVDIFDTILRDGSQQEGLSLTVTDKLRVAEQLVSQPQCGTASRARCEATPTTNAATGRRLST